MLTNILGRRWVQVVVLLAILGGLAFVRLKDYPFIYHVRQLTFDAYNRYYPRKSGDETVIVDIDEGSLSKYGQWPWPRTVLADLVNKLHAMGAQVIAFDMVFAENDRTSPRALMKEIPDISPEALQALGKLPDNDEVFAKAVAAASNVVLGYVAAREPTNFTPPASSDFCASRNDYLPYLYPTPYFVVNLPMLSGGAAGHGIFTSHPDDDGVIRMVPLVTVNEDKEKKQLNIYPALSLEAVRLWYRDKHLCYMPGNSQDITNQVPGVHQVTLMEQGKKKIGDLVLDVGTPFRIIPTERDGKIRVYYAGHRPRIYVPAWKVLQGQVDPGRFKNKIVFIGTSAIGLLDLRSSPLDTNLPGVEIHTEIVEQILHNQFLNRPYEMDGIELWVALLISAGIIFLTPFVSAGTIALLVTFLIGGGIAGSLWAYTQGVLVDPVYPSAIILVIFIGSSILMNLRTEMEKRMIRQVFDRYLSPALIEELVKDPSRLKLGGDVRELSVMFTDIRNFTTISESMDPAELIRMMNDFLTPMTSAVLENKGFVDKYMGDAMMTFWNAPVDDPNHARNACKAALEMVEALKPVNAELRSRAEKAGRPFHELKAGIGINSGRASVGNMGSKQRFAYSALGDTVNLASRLEGQTKVYGITAMISHSTRLQVPDFALVELDLLTVKGRTEPERVYALLGDESLAQKIEFRNFTTLHIRMLEAYRGRQWDEALKLMAECAGLRPDLAALYHLYAERIGYYKEHPPGPEWTGVWVAKEK